jgi:MFS transporter, FSR family, fosmidomycin resistance protein
LYLANKLGYSSAGIGVALFVMQAVAFSSAPLAGYASDKLGRKSVMIGAMVMSAIVMFLMAVAGESAWTVFLIAMLGFFMYATRPVIQAWSLEAAPGGTVVGIMFCIQALGSAVSPWAGGAIADGYGLTAIFYFLTGLMVAANVLILFVPEPEPRTRSA